MITDKLISYVLGGALVLSLGGAIVQTTRLHSAQLGKAEAEVALATDRREAAAKLVQETAQIRKAEQSLQASAAATRKQINEATTSITAQRDALLARVRLAEARAARLAMSSASAAPSADQAGPVDHGPELLGSFGAADVDEAGRAELIRSHLLACYRDYEAAEAALSTFHAK